MMRKIFLILTIVWMAVIFAFSARPADESEEDSIQVGMMIGRIFIPEFEEWSQESRYEFAERIDHPVRKTAHATEYAILGLLVAGAYIRGGTSPHLIYAPRGCAGIRIRIMSAEADPNPARKTRERVLNKNGGKDRSERTGIGKGILIPWAVATVYAATDEFHQLFVPGRSGQISDVLLDSAGVMAGLLVLAAVRSCRKSAGNFQKNVEE